MSAQTEADVKQLQQDMAQQQQAMFLLQQNITNLNMHMYAAMEAVVERLQAIEGDEVVVKAAPNGQAKTKKAHR